MKIKTIERKLQLRKETVTSLNSSHMNGVKGGVCGYPNCCTRCCTECNQNTCNTCVTCNTCNCTVYDNTCASICDICASNQQGGCNW